MTEKVSGGGTGILLAKLGPKLLSLILKLKTALITLFKTLFNIKTVGLVASAAMYSYLFTWQMGIALVAFIGIHEYGHLWAMHRCGIRTKGMFFIPGIGAVAVADERFGSAKNESYIALMGPVWGLLGFVLPIIAIFAVTHDRLWAAIASFTTFVNLVNLFPVNPLDGGRVVKSLVYSKNASQSLITAVLISFFGVIVAAFAHLTLFVYLALIGFADLLTEFGISKRLGSLMITLFRAAGASIFLIAVSGLLHGNNWVFTIFEVVAVFAIAVLLIADVHSTAERNSGKWYGYPFFVLVEIFKIFGEFARLQWSHITPIENYERMNAGQKWFYSASFIGLVAIHAVILVGLALIPEASIGSSLLH